MNDTDTPTINTMPLNAPVFSISSIDLDDIQNAGDDAEVITMTGPSLKEVVKPSTGCITEDEGRIRMGLALDLDIPSLAELRGKYAGQKLILCGGGGSIARTLPDIIKQRADVKIMCVNKTHDWLVENGITPDFAVLMDPRAHVPDYVNPVPGVKYLFASVIDPRAFERCKDYEIYLWHPIGTSRDAPYVRDILQKKYPCKSVAMIPGPSTVGLRALYLGMDILGFSEIEMHGFDSCYDHESNTLWAYKKPVTFEPVRIDYSVIAKSDGAVFKCMSNPDMARQVYEFDKMIELFIGSLKAGARKSLAKLTVAGDGAIPWMAWKNGGHATPERMLEKYGQSRIYDYHMSLESYYPSAFTGPSKVGPSAFMLGTV